MRKPLFIFSCMLMVALPLAADEGMFPISEIHRLNLKETGLRTCPACSATHHVPPVVG